jgi:hypothetical protein
MTTATKAQAEGAIDRLNREKKTPRATRRNCELIGNAKNNKFETMDVSNTQFPHYWGSYKLEYPQENVEISGSLDTMTGAALATLYYDATEKARGVSSQPILSFHNCHATFHKPQQQWTAALDAHSLSDGLMCICGYTNMYKDAHAATTAGATTGTHTMCIFGTQMVMTSTGVHPSGNDYSCPATGGGTDTTAAVLALLHPQLQGGRAGVTNHVQSCATAESLMCHSGAGAHAAH